ncbi:DEAH-box RNA-dependent ATPase PRP2 [Saccharomyces paradoxus]|uniref:RNA helicase n=1 Tax=Saccharomyces paradoxus TaxID=27291 RepID=A0A8B8UZ00_SACPA|nr:Prp2 [Saccharomyces paradoxus]QHS75911.1 Prp2 [Saccharomyces paradoxus]
MSNTTSGTGKRRVKRTYEVTRQDETAIGTGSSSVGEEEDKEAENKNFTSQPKRSRYDPNKTFSYTNQASKSNDLKEEPLESQKRSLKYGGKTRSNNELTSKKGVLSDSENKAEDASSNAGCELEATHKIRNAKESDKINRQHIWEEQQLRNAMARKSDHPDDIVVEGSDKYDYVFDTDAMIDYTNEEDDMLPEEKLQYEARLAKALETEEKRILTIQEARKLLPVHQYKDELLREIKKHQVLIIMGETGSGKTTQLPQYLVEDGYTDQGKLQIAITQPRRVAATSVAARVADEMNVVLGKEVGYQIRFEDKTTPNKTVLKYMTDGMLLREFLTDSKLTKYSCIMIDEAHERTLATDILIGLLKEILPRRPTLKLLISSATMNAKKFSEFFDDCPIFNVPGRRYPVDIHYTLQPEANYIHAAITTIFQIHTTQSLPGDILVFLTGQEEIERTKIKLEEIMSKLGSRTKQMLITPIYANLPQEQQLKIFQQTPENCRKVVLATNIAETSLTIDGIKYVIDPGFVKENSYVPSTGMTQLLTVPCSRASVDQRAGRAGRVGPGKCFRIFTKWSYSHELELMPKPEITRTNLSNTVLLLLSLGVTDLIKFPLMDKPSIPALRKSLENLYILGALNSKGTITRLGKMMCEFPCEPEFAKVLYTAATHEQCQGVIEECLTIVSMLHETSSLFIGQKRDAAASVISEVESDHMLYLEIFNQWRSSKFSRSWCQDHKIQFKTMLRVRNIRNQLFRCSEKVGLVEKNDQARMKVGNIAGYINGRITRCFISGFPMNIVQLGPTGYQTMGKSSGGLNVSVHPSSILFVNYKEKAQRPSKYVLYQQLMLTSKEFIRDCLVISKEEWLIDMVPQIFKSLIEDKTNRGRQ